MGENRKDISSELFGATAPACTDDRDALCALPVIQRQKGTFLAAALSLSSQKHPLPSNKFTLPGPGSREQRASAPLPAAPEPELPVGKAQPEGMCCSKTVKTAPVLRSRPLRSYVPLRGFPNESVSESNTTLPADFPPRQSRFSDGSCTAPV